MMSPSGQILGLDEYVLCSSEVWSPLQTFQGCDTEGSGVDLPVDPRPETSIFDIVAIQYLPGLIDVLVRVGFSFWNSWVLKGPLRRAFFKIDGPDSPLRQDFFPSSLPEIFD
jgi:hypothetical protein